MAMRNGSKLTSPRLSPLLVIATLLSLLALLASANPAAARPLPVRSYALPPETTLGGLTRGPGGAIWFTLDPYLGAPQLGRIDFHGRTTYVPLDLQTGTFGPPVANSITSASAAELWFTLSGGPGGQIGRLSRSGHLDFFPLPAAARFPEAIAPGPGHSLWFTMNGSGYRGQAVGSINAQGKIALFPLPSDQFTGPGITEGADGNVWFLAEDSVRHWPSHGLIGRLTPRGKLREFRIPGDGASSIAAGRHAIWFIDGSAVGRISTSGRTTIYPLPAPNSSVAWPVSLIAAADGNLWFTQVHPFGLGRLSASGEISQFPTRAHSTYGGQIAIGTHGDLWFPENGALGRLRPRLIGTPLRQVAPAGGDQPIRLRLICRQLAQPCAGTVRIEVQSILGKKAPQRLVTQRYRMALGETRVVPLRLSASDRARIAHARRSGNPVTVGTYEPGGYASDRLLRFMGSS